MAESIDQLRVSFVEETRDLINELEDILLSLENDSVSSEVIDQIFRSVHTIKGSGGMLGFEKVLEVTHDLEDIYDKVRGGEMEFTSDLKEISLETIDVLKNLLETDENLDDNEKVRFVNLCRKIQLFEVGSSSVVVEDDEADVITTDVESEAIVTYIIHVNPGFSTPKILNHPKYLVHELAQLGSSIAYAKSGDNVRINNFEKVNKGSAWIVVLATSVSVETMEGIFSWVKDEIEVKVEKLVDGNLIAVEKALAELNEVGEEVFNKTWKDFVRLAKKYEKELAAQGEKSEKVIIDAPVIKESASSGANTISSIRVSTDKIDQLMNLVSEMVTLQARLNLIATELDDPALLDVTEKYGSFSKQLRDNAFTISLIPFGVSMTRYKRMVHDLSDQLNKKVDFITEGADTVLDKKIIDQLSDPIMHILRNSIDHGIEDVAVRKKIGKSEVGQINMNVFHQSNNVIIEINDDGGGIDLDVIKKIALDKQLISVGQNISDNDLLNLIFLPGFSSAKSVSNVSGRGVGLDVVRKNIADIRGTIDIETRKGKGTTFTIKLPLTLSIIDGLQVKVEDRDIIVPLVQVDRIETLSDIIEDERLNQFVVLDGAQIPFFDLRSDFEIAGDVPERREIVVASYENEKVALVVDYVVGENQTVLKPLGKHFKKQDFISGGTILGDGSVALVLDINKIVTVFSKK